MARAKLRDISPWRGAPLTIPPDSVQAWVRLAAWEVWMGVLLYGALHFGTQLMISARQGSLVSLQGGRLGSGCSVPNACRPVRRGGDDTPAIGTKGGSHHSHRMTLQYCSLAPARCVP